MEPCPKLNLLGSSISLAETYAGDALPSRKTKDLSHDLRATLQRDVLAPSQAAKFRGRLGWAQSLHVGRFGRAMLQLPPCRQYSKLDGRLHLSDDLMDVIQWRLSAIACTTPRRISCANTQTNLVYSDAFGAGHLGAVCIRLGSYETVSAHAPDWFAKIAKIMKFEQAGDISGILTAREISPARPILLRFDNEGAAAAIIRGSCRSELGRLVAAVFWPIAAALGIAVWVETGLSELNPSDPPSRISPLTSKPAKPTGVIFGPPTSCARIFADRASFLNAQYKFTHMVCVCVWGGGGGGGEFCEPFPFGPVPNCAETLVTILLYSVSFPPFLL